VARWRRDLAVPRGTPKGSGDLRDREVEVVAQGDGGALLGVEGAEGALQLVAVREGSAAVGLDGVPEQPDLARIAPATAQQVRAGVDDEAVQPSVPAIRIAEARQLPPGVKERVLHRVLREG
jgi:hypothetical protein